jgi:transcriptional regulator with XRE-family HTH domain
MMIDYNAVGIRIKIARIKAGITQSSLAEQINITPAHMSNIETGNAKLSLQTLISIANALSVSVDELLCDNVISSNHVFLKEAQEVLADCSPYEIRILLDILKSSKDALRKNERFDTKVRPVKER